MLQCDVIKLDVMIIEYEWNIIMDMFEKPAPFNITYFLFEVFLWSTGAMLFVMTSAFYVTLVLLEIVNANNKYIIIASWTLGMMR